jgi:hypothetical protein
VGALAKKIEGGVEPTLEQRLAKAREQRLARFQESIRRRLDGMPGPAPRAYVDPIGFFRGQAALEAGRVARLLDSDKQGAERKAGPSRRRRAKMIVPTDERLAKGDQVEWVNPAEIDSSEQQIGLTRRFKASHLDRLYRNNSLSWVEWYAGDWYRNQHARCGFALSVVGGYGVATSAGETSYGLPRTEAQARARQVFMAARKTFPIAMVAFMERLLIEDDMPRLGGRAALRNVIGIRRALDQLAEWLFLGRGTRRPIADASDAVEPAVEQVECEAEIADVPLPDVDPAFLDEDGRMRPFEEIRAIIIARLGVADEAS